jgi:ABC-type antimicrobial peptide transport system permease subunit
VGFVVAERSREIGIRTALGAGRGQVLRALLGETAVLVVVGVGLGIAGATLLAGRLEHQLYGLSPLDPGTFAAAAGLFATATIASAFGPAWRAATASPVEVLHAE